MGKINVDIKNNYTKYQELVQGIKKTSVQLIELDEIKKNHANTRFKSVKLTHDIHVNDDLQLIVESKVTDKRDFTEVMLSGAYRF